MRWRREAIASPASRLLTVSCASVCVIATRLLWRRPVKVKGMTMWDRYDLDDAFEELKHGCGEPTENTVHKRLRELEDEQRKKGRPE